MASGTRLLPLQLCLSRIQKSKSESSYIWRNNDASESSGGLIYALIAGKDTQGTIDFAVAASCLTHSIEHDFNLVKVKDVEALAAGNGTGRVQR